MREDATREEVCFVGEIMLVICGATKRKKSMDDLGLVNYYKKLEGKSAIKPEALLTKSLLTSTGMVRQIFGST